MKTVTLTFTVNPKDYHRTRNTDAGVKALVKAMLRGEADFPDAVQIEVRAADFKDIQPMPGYPKGVVVFPR